MSVLSPLVSRLDARLRRVPAASSLWPANAWQLLGHLVIICFVILAITGVFLAIPYDPGIDPVAYHGGSRLYDGVALPRAFASVVRISEDVPGGLFVRRVHEASAHLLTAVAILHMVRVLYSGAFQGRRAVNHVVGLALLGAVLVAGWTGENLPFGLLAGTSLRIGYSVLDSIPYVGEPLSLLVYGGDYPTGAILTRSFWLHSLVLPAAIAAGTAMHLWLYRRHTPTEHPASGDHERLRGVMLWPELTRRLLALGAAITGLLALSTALVPWSDIELEGPYQLAQAGNTLQPPWFLFFPEGAMRLLPAIHVPLPGGASISNVFVAAVALPAILTGVLVLYPWIDPHLGGSGTDQHVMQHPLAVPGRAAAVTALLAVLAVLTAGATVDVLAQALQVPVSTIIVILRVTLLIAPVLAGAAAWALASKRQVT